VSFSSEAGVSVPEFSPLSPWPALHIGPPSFLAMDRGEKGPLLAIEMVSGCVAPFNVLLWSFGLPGNR
jgi:hypothetical protein